MQQFRLKGGAIAGFADFWMPSAQNDTKNTALERFEDALKILPNNCTENALKMDFKDISDGHIFLVNFQYFSVVVLSFLS